MKGGGRRKCHTSARKISLASRVGLDASSPHSSSWLSHSTPSRNELVLGLTSKPKIDIAGKKGHQSDLACCLPCVLWCACRHTPLVWGVCVCERMLSSEYHEPIAFLKYLCWQPHFSAALRTHSNAGPTLAPLFYRQGLGSLRIWVRKVI